jgi:hypothetical protein
MPKIGELWRNNNDGRIVKIVNISTGGKYGRRTFLHIMAYNPRSRTTVGGEVVLVWDSRWDQNWEKYEHDDSSGVDPRATSSTVSKSSGSDAPMTPQKAPRGGVPPLPLTSRPQYKDGGVMPTSSSGSNERGRSRAFRSGFRRDQRQQAPYWTSSDEELDLDTGTGYETQEQAVTRNLSHINGRWILSREFNGNSGRKRIEIGQEIVVIGQRSSAQTGGPALVICKYNSFHTGQLRMVQSAIRKNLFIDGTFIFRAWGLNIGDDPPNPPSYEAAMRQRQLMVHFGFFKNNINIKF